MIKIQCCQVYWLAACIVFAGLFYSLPLIAQQQNSRIDSIKQAYKIVKTDSDRVTNLIELSKEIDCEDFGSKVKAAEQALQLARQINWEKGNTVANIVLGLAYAGCSHDYTQSNKYFLEAIETAKSSGNTQLEALSDMYLANSYRTAAQYAKAIEAYRDALKLDIKPETRMGVLSSMGSTYATVGDYPIALAIYDSSLKVLDELILKKKKSNKDDSLQIAGLDITIADIYIANGEYDHALKKYNAALQLCEATKYKPWVILSLMGIGKTWQVKKDDDKAIESYNKALEMCIRINNHENELGIYNQLGKLYQRKGMTGKAMEYAQSALKLTVDDPYSTETPITYTLLGKIYTQKKQYDKAVSYLGRAVDTCKHTGALDDEKDALEGLSAAYQQMGKPAQALIAYKEFIAIRDSVHSIDNAKAVTRMEMTSDFETTQLADSLKHAQEKLADSVKHAQEKKVVVLELQKQRAISIGSIVGILLVLVLAFFVYRNYRQAKTANAIINAEKQRADEQRDRAERSEQFKQQFLANMSHEIRTPMNAVSGMTDLLLDKNPRPDQTNYLQVISHSSDILLHLINDILDLSKIEAGKLEMESVDFSLADTVRQVRETLAVRAEEKGLQIVTQISEDIPDVLIGDPFRLTQILINLGSNAVKFTDRGSVEISANKTDGDDENVVLQLSVTDTGIGIPADKLRTIFESFTQVSSSDSRRYGGTGLGLSISRQLVELQGGTISVQSTEGRGTVFSFVITYKKGSAEALAARNTNDRHVDGNALNGLRILLADDNENNRLVANDALRLKAEVFIDEAVNGEQAIQMLQQNNYDVILMDVQMPVMDGLEASRYIRSEMGAPKCSTPIIALTASMLRNDLDKCLSAGMSTYVPKPFKTWQLIDAIAEVTGRKNSSPIDEALPGTQQAPRQVTDLTYLRDFCEQEEDRIKKYISIYINALPAFEENVKNALHANNTEEIASLMHLFRPRWMMMGMNQSADLGRRIETMCIEPGHGEKIGESVALLLALNTQSVSEIGSWV